MKLLSKNIKGSAFTALILQFFLTINNGNIRKKLQDLLIVFYNWSEKLSLLIRRFIKLSEKEKMVRTNTKRR